MSQLMLPWVVRLVLPRGSQRVPVPSAACHQGFETRMHASHHAHASVHGVKHASTGYVYSCVKVRIILLLVFGNG